MTMDANISTSTDDAAKFSQLVNEIEIQTGELFNFIKKSSQNLQENSKTEKGLSLLDVKNHLMLNYLIDLSFLMLKKLDKKSIKNDPTIRRLAETRVVLERIRPIESKLKYQIDKYMKILSSSRDQTDTTGSDPLKFKANLENFDDQDSDASSAEAEVDEYGEKKATGTYVPPKLMAMPYLDERSKEERALERAKRRALTSSLVHDLREQYSEAPAEIRDNLDVRRKKQLDQSKKRTDYEESNLFRMPITKKQRQVENRSRTDSTLNYLLNFGDYNVEEIAKKNNKKFKGTGPGKGQKSSRAKGKKRK